MHQQSQPDLAVELAFRENDGMAVSLLWVRVTNEVLVAVDDTTCGHRFELAVADGESPMDVFWHPYAYVALRQPDAAAACSPLG